MGTSPSPEIVDLELAIIVRPAGRLLLAGQVPTLTPLREIRGDVRFWMRWAEDTGLEGARIEIAASTARDEKARTARVVARAVLAHPTRAWSVYGLLEIQGLTDLLVTEPVAPDRPPSELVHWLVCADLSRRSAGYGLSVDCFPKYYV